MKPHLIPMSVCLSRASCMVVLALASAAFAADRPAFTITELKPPPGSIAIEPTKINDRGDIIGFTYGVDGDDHTFLYRNGALQDLLPSVPTAHATDINNAGQITCFVLATPAPYAAVISPDGSVVNLNQLLHDSVYPIAMNDVGDLIYAGDAGSSVYNFIDGTTSHVEEPRIVELKDINNRGQFIGDYIPEDYSSSSGALLDGTHLTYFQLPGRIFTFPVAINNQGQVAGLAYNESSSFTFPTPFIYEDGHFKHLGSLPGDDGASPFAINDSGEVVGWSERALQGRSRAFLYTNHKLYDLNTLIAGNAGWTLEWAVSNNNQGQIVGSGTLNGEQRGFLLTPIEPNKK